jgi:hypothetical protein
MKIIRYALIASAAVGTALAGAAYAGLLRHPTEFYVSHTHDEHGDAIGAPQHSGGLDAYGCHNASVPYHCHR